MILYLHGFASGPGSFKARAMAERFGRLGVGVAVPDLTPGEDGFERSTPASMLEIAGRALAREAPPHAIIGSSLGGWLGAFLASRDPGIRRLVLLAPAFGLAERWRARLTPQEAESWKREGLEVEHHASNRKRRIGWGFMESALALPPYPEVRVPCLCFAGRRDEVVPFENVERFVSMTPSARLIALDDGHELTASIDRIWEETRAFLGR